MESIEETINRIQALLETNEAQPYVLFSGGKDSLTTLSLVKDASKRLGKKIVAVHADTTVGLPENLDYVQRICQFLVACQRADISLSFSLAGNDPASLL